MYRSSMQSSVERFENRYVYAKIYIQNSLISGLTICLDRVVDTDAIDIMKFGKCDFADRNLVILVAIYMQRERVSLKYLKPQTFSSSQSFCKIVPGSLKRLL